MSIARGHTNFHKFVSFERKRNVRRTIEASLPLWRNDTNMPERSGRTPVHNFGSNKNEVGVREAFVKIAVGDDGKHVIPIEKLISNIDRIFA